MKPIKHLLFSAAVAAIAASPLASYASDDSPETPAYTPTPEIIRAQEQFRNHGFGIFIHWGIYSMFAQGEWYLNYGASAKEYAKAAGGFYPANFDAVKWVRAIKEAGARYICFTTRHHDGFSMWHTAQSPFNIVDATPFKRDILKELADACRQEGIALHLYYSHIDWSREDFPSGRTGLQTGRDISKRDYNSYFNFMNSQLTELLTNYGPIGAVWFDGVWDHDEDETPFDWRLDEQYELVHRLQPSCLIGNNHHITPFPGENIQIFERDLPGENTAGLSGQEIARLPLETCQTMNGMWGYKIMDQNYKSERDLIHYLVRAAGMGANLLLNIGPQPSGDLPEAALERLSAIGRWMDRYGETFYDTDAGPFAAQPWGTSTRRGNKLYIHVLDNDPTEIYLPMTERIASATEFDNGRKVAFQQTRKGYVLTLSERPAETVDHIVELTLKD
ncbi:MAG: alpha-L-fucosidase [Clostridium sp.]|nr:alpha-L-fucosidase [Clostridium sp.]